MGEEDAFRVELELEPEFRRRVPRIRADLVDRLLEVRSRAPVAGRGADLGEGLRTEAVVQHATEVLSLAPHRGYPQPPDGDAHCAGSGTR